jgi:hypothetical protein
MHQALHLRQNRAAQEATWATHTLVAQHPRGLLLLAALETQGLMLPEVAAQVGLQQPHALLLALQQRLGTCTHHHAAR